MPMYNLIRYSDNYSKTPRSLWEYYSDKLAANTVNSEFFKSNTKITEKASTDNNTKDIKIAATLKHLSTILKTLKRSLVNCEVDLSLTSADSAIFLQLE